ncbi:YceI family protein [Pigmentibacter sp. JX0631]|uniref:YceI family protein n=1 Tax=Pigmentibacter sp. JX0631 TaxID=2976982 RepID=UPI0024684471|nr:YceI family protein [Pigmentibacter sp. JX0631]WGL60238.1 YceI family protein [Pigmentibacter sp. JX0631]
MRSIDLSKLLVLTSLIVTPINVLANSTNTKTETVIAAAEVAKDYSIDPDHSKVSFEVAHLVISSVTGEFKKFKGNFKFNPEDFSQTQLEATAEINSIDTSVKKRDDHLKSPDFFDAKKFPVMTFKSTGAKKTGDKTFELTGDMTIKGTSKPVTFKVTHNGQIKDKTKVLQAFKAVAEINRKDFGVNFQAVVEAGPVVGDTVTINIACEGTRKP